MQLEVHRRFLWRDQQPLRVSAVQAVRRMRREQIRVIGNISVIRALALGS
jgi:hypothetical protein